MKTDVIMENKGKTSSPVFSSFLVKIVSRCNLNCDYCYMYKHIDQSWKKQPVIMTPENRKMLAHRIGEYARHTKLESCLVIFHGGEPLLAGEERIVETAKWIREAVPDYTQVDFSVQTNGVLLKQHTLDCFAKENIAISLSLDGTKNANDLHRLTHKGKSSYDNVMRAYRLLKGKPELFVGVISVVDVRNSPKELLDFFNQLDPPSLDFLLPDSNHLSPPPFRNERPTIYRDWLIEAFDTWYDKYSHIPLRTFDALMGAVLGSPSGTDSFGFGDVTLLSIETDGSYHDLDVLKITEEGRSSLYNNLEGCSIAEIASSPKIAEHRELLSFTGLCKTCQKCPVVDVCGGGSVPHRFGSNGFKNPTIFCREMKDLIGHIRSRLEKESPELMSSINNENDQLNFKIEPYIFSEETIENDHNYEILKKWRQNMRNEFAVLLKEFNIKFEEYQSSIAEILNKTEKELDILACRPSVRFWLHVLNKNLQNQDFLNSCGEVVNFDPSYIQEIAFMDTTQNEFQIHRNDKWLRLPFRSDIAPGSDIEFEPEEIALKAEEPLRESLKIIKEWDPLVYREMLEISPEIQFIRDKNFPERIVSFSDNIAPGALYISIRSEEHILSPYHIADSLIHEYRHQKLYIFDNLAPLILRDSPLIVSPWRQDPRPPSGLFHAMFVFTKLLSFWKYVHSLKRKADTVNADQEANSILDKLIAGYKVLGTCALTPMGRNFLEVFEDIISNSLPRLSPST